MTLLPAPLPRSLTVLHRHSRRLYLRRRRAARAHNPIREIQRAMRWTGLFTWLAVSLHAYLNIPSRPERLGPQETLPWVLSLLLFLLTFLAGTWQRPDLTGRRRILALSAASSALALTSNAIFDGSNLLCALLLLVAAQVALVLGVQQALLWVAAQTTILLSVLLRFWTDADAWAYTTGYLCFQVFAVTTAQTAVREIQARQRLVAAMEELRATRALLAETSRQAERLRISRELHDVLGHSLTALSMHLQVAAHLTPDSPARPHLECSQRVARQLLGDVRATVRDMRETTLCNFQEEMERLRQDAPLTVHLKYTEGFQLHSPVHAHILLRTAQEILTNAVRHARASNIWLDFGRDATHVSLHAHDDGRAATAIKPGCGLSGMQERLESIGGCLHLRHAPGQPLHLHATFPTQGAS